MKAIRSGLVVLFAVLIALIYEYHNAAHASYTDAEWTTCVQALIAEQTGMFLSCSELHGAY